MLLLTVLRVPRLEGTKSGTSLACAAATQSGAFGLYCLIGVDDVGTIPGFFRAQSWLECSEKLTWGRVFGPERCSTRGFGGKSHWFWIGIAHRQR